ncbi:MAG: hypothetical protein KGJ56_08160 [Gammaproteobacteria bacterium]|nr:hypothetical protein [Gammaproteobacteria bacterium]
MKSMKLWLVPAIAVLCVSGVQAAETETASVIRDYTDTVAPAEQQAYEAGIKSYNQCLSQHGFKYAWTAWVHETGNVYEYSYVSDPGTWGSFDDMQTAGQACDQTFRTDVNPHLLSETSAFFVGMPEISYMPESKMGTPALIGVRYFKLKPGHRDAFMKAAKKINAAAKKAKAGNFHMFGEVVYGGSGAPDLILVLPMNSWAELGQDLGQPWKMLESVYGQKMAAVLHKQILDSIEATSVHVDRYNAGLSYTPPK